jgi:hypothetical protein
MIEHLDLDRHSSAASLLDLFGEAAPDLVAAEAVAQLEMQDFAGYVTLKKILDDIEKLLAERGAAKAS